MRLINVHSLALHEFYGEAIPPYCILSHTWNDGEVTYQDWQTGDLDVISQRPGYAKIRGACRQAERHGIDWLWVDTNCIDKTSSTELTEAINSMYHWYKNAYICYAYLVDVATAEIDLEEQLRQFRASRWFTRGWTLQELLAPEHLRFYAADWTKIGSKDRSLATEVFAITGIDATFLMGEESIMSASVSKRMSWLAKRTTTRVEDMAYCMLGLFDINMPLLYGEGAKAFTRLQEEIIKVSEDHTIFCWSWGSSVPKNWVSLLAPLPSSYENAAHFTPTHHTSSTRVLEEISVYSMTNAGLSIRLPLVHTWNFYAIVLNAGADNYFESQQLTEGTTNRRAPSAIEGSIFCRACIPVIGEQTKDALRIARLPYPRQPLLLNKFTWGEKLETESLVAITRLDRMKWVVDERKDVKDYPRRFGLFFLFGSEQVRSAWMAPRTSFPEQAIDQPAGILGLNVRNGVGACLINLSLTFSKDGLAQWRKQGGVLAFFAVKLVGGFPKWFCKIGLPEQECSPYDQEAMRNELDKWKREVIQSKGPLLSWDSRETGVYIQIFGQFPSAETHTMALWIRDYLHPSPNNKLEYDRLSISVEPSLKNY